MKYIGFPRPSYPLALRVEPVCLVTAIVQVRERNAVMASADIWKRKYGRFEADSLLIQTK